MVVSVWKQKIIPFTEEEIEGLWRLMRSAIIQQPQLKIWGTTFFKLIAEEWEKEFNTRTFDSLKTKAIALNKKDRKRWEEEMPNTPNYGECKDYNEDLKLAAKTKKYSEINDAERAFDNPAMNDRYTSEETVPVLRAIIEAGSLQFENPQYWVDIKKSPDLLNGTHEDLKAIFTWATQVGLSKFGLSDEELKLFPSILCSAEIGTDDDENSESGRLPAEEAIGNRTSEVIPVRTERSRLQNPTCRPESDNSAAMEPSGSPRGLSQNGIKNADKADINRPGPLCKKKMATQDLACDLNAKCPDSDLSKAQKLLDEIRTKLPAGVDPIRQQGYSLFVGILRGQCDSFKRYKQLQPITGPAMTKLEVDNAVEDFAKHLNDKDPIVAKMCSEALKLVKLVRNLVRVAEVSSECQTCGPKVLELFPKK